MKRLLECAVLSFLSSVSFATAQQSPGRPCPIACDVAGNNPTNWTDLHGVPALKRCGEPILFDTSIFMPIEDPKTPLTLRTCTVSNKVVEEKTEYNPAPFTFGSSVHRRDYTNSTNSTSSGNSIGHTQLYGCTLDAETFTNKTIVDSLIWELDRNGAKDVSKTGILSAAEALKKYLFTRDDCDSTVMMARHGDAVVGLYVGTEVVTSSASSVVESFLSALQREEDVSRLAGQVCRDNTPSTWTVGIYADFRGNISSVQESLRTWAEGKCLGGYDSKGEPEEKDMTFVYATGVPVRTGLFLGLEQISEPAERVAKRELIPRAECKAIQVGNGDGCFSLAQRCGISQTQFTNYNKDQDLCDPIKGVKPKQWVCCSSGDLPDMGPKPNADGSCATYEVQAEDVCFDIAEAHQITVEKITQLNNNTWGWGGCASIQPGDKICLSKGDPPMPAQRTNAMCGPQVPGTQRPSNFSTIPDLNPCPLNVCCNVWGQCGTTDDFCLWNPADTGAPGTTKPGKNSCVSSCGMNIMNNDKGPDEFRKIAYFEAWNHNRPCLHMDVTDIDKNKYTHIHFSFPDITTDYKVDISKHEEQFEKMKEMTGIKRIVSFGGWAFSTEAPTYNIFREGVTDANRLTLATNIANFITENGLDGVDFDWEYPSAPDIPGIPAGEIEAGKQYLEFLKVVKRRLPNKSVAIAAPASYWYLKGFPIAEISKVVDYIVYMTYDLHGQWDYGSKWSTPGCPEGNCLRSHINITETTNALAMVTKAGVPSHKVVVGVSSYGRSFHMEVPDCIGPMCRFTGTANQSDAMPGDCTETEGYISNAEIRDILAKGRGGLGWTINYDFHDAESNSDILVYDDYEWVAYMSDATKQTRTDWVKGLNFGGTSDWAVDLDQDYGDDGIGNDDPDAIQMGGGPLCEEPRTYNSLEKIAGAELEPMCATFYTLRVLWDMLQSSMKKFNAVNDGYDAKFQSYIKYMKKGLPETLRLHTHWLDGEAQKYFDCDFKGNGKTYKGQCPVPDSIRGTRLSGEMTVQMTLRDKDGFYKNLYDKTGIMEDWIVFGTEKDETFCNPFPCDRYEVEVNGIPKLKEGYEIPDPKDIVVKAMGNSGNLVNELLARKFDAGLGIWTGSYPDLIVALSTPVFLIENAIEGMEDAKELGEEADKEAAKQELLTILSLVFLIVPVIGEAAAIAAGAATMARVIALIGAGANTGLALRDVIENPEMAPFAIMELLTAGRLRSPNEYADAVKFRKAMKADDLRPMGTKFIQQDEWVQKIATKCRR